MHNPRKILKTVPGMCQRSINVIYCMTVLILEMRKVGFRVVK